MTDRRGLKETVPSQGYDDWMEENLNDIADCGAERISRRARWEIDKARRESELESVSLNTTKEALDPGEEIEWGISPGGGGCNPAG